MSHLTLELIVNVLLLAFGIFCYFYVGATMPASDPLELGAEQWPQAVPGAFVTRARADQ